MSCDKTKMQIIRGAYRIKMYPNFWRHQSFLLLLSILLVFVVKPHYHCCQTPLSSESLILLINAADFCRHHCQRSFSCLSSLALSPHSSSLSLPPALFVVATVSPSHHCRLLFSLLLPLVILVVVIALSLLLHQTMADPVACMKLAVSGVDDGSFTSGDTYSGMDEKNKGM